MYRERIFCIFPICLLLFCFALLNQSFAQPKLLEKMQVKYPTEKAVFLQKSRQLFMQLKDKKLSVSTRNYSEMLHLAQNSAKYATESVPFSAFCELTQIEAKTLIPTKQGYKALKVNEFKTQSLWANHVFFDDQKEKTFVFPAIGVGAKTILAYQEQIKEPRLLGAYYLNANVPTEKSEFIVKTSAAIKVKYKLFGMQNMDIDYKTYQKNAETVHHWIGRNLKKYKQEKNTAYQKDDEPHIVVYIESIETEEGKQTILPDVAALYAWYYGLIEQNMGKQNADIQELASSLTKNIADTLQQANILYSWVQKNIRYIAFEDGLGGLVPRLPAEVYARRYGDCKDMANLLLTMARAVGLRAYPTWVGTRQIPYQYSELPLPMVDNHFIVTFLIEKKSYFVDATEENLPFGLPSAFIQGKQALVGFNKFDFALQDIPIFGAVVSTKQDEYKLKIENKHLIGTQKSVLKGYLRTNALQMLEETIGMQQTKKLQKNRQNNFANLQTYKDYAMLDKEILAKDSLVLEYNFLAADLAKQVNHETFINLHFEPNADIVPIDTANRKTAIAFDFAYLESTKIILQLPINAKVDYLPAESKFDNPQFSFAISYQIIDSQIIMSKNITINCLMIKKTDFVTWNEFVKKLQAAYQETLVFHE
jgi:hypothetical protein